MKKKHIYLIGFMGVGKSSIARRLSGMLRLPMLEMDEALEKREGISISEIFKRCGEEYFRNLETALLRSIKEEPASIVSCGGGAVLREENLRLMRESGVIVQLTAAPESILKRVRHSLNRPILNGNMNVDYIRGLLEKRAPLYEKAADFSISTDEKSIEEICQEIEKLLS